MQLTLENPDFDYFLRGANGSVALVNDRRLDRSFIVAPDTLVEDWGVASVDALTVADLEAVLALDPEVVLLGSGERQVFLTAPRADELPPDRWLVAPVDHRAHDSPATRVHWRRMRIRS